MDDVFGWTAGHPSDEVDRLSLLISSIWLIVNTQITSMPVELCGSWKSVVLRWYSGEPNLSKVFRYGQLFEKYTPNAFVTSLIFE